MGMVVLLYATLLGLLTPAVKAACSRAGYAPADATLNALWTDSTWLEVLPSFASSTKAASITALSPNSYSVCDPGCLRQLLPYIAPHNGSILYIRKGVIGELLPPGYSLIEPASSYPKPINCVLQEGICGATVPLYRHFALNMSGIYHKYSLGSEDSFENYLQELRPLCYFWEAHSNSRSPTSMRKARQATECDFQACMENKANLNQLSPLIEYVNSENGPMRDHYYTTLGESSSDVIGFDRVRVLGWVRTEADASCDCSVTLIQAFDYQTGLIDVAGRSDHKLMVEGKEKNRFLEKYKTSGERYYCVSVYGGCGATLPLYKHFDFVHIDSILVTTDDAVDNAYRYPFEPLCYIWAIDYTGPQETTTESATISILNVETTAAPLTTIQLPDSSTTEEWTTESPTIEILVVETTAVPNTTIQFQNSSTTEEIWWTANMSSPSNTTTNEAPTTPMPSPSTTTEETTDDYISTTEFVPATTEEMWNMTEVNISKALQQLMENVAYDSFARVLAEWESRFRAFVEGR